MKISKIDDSNMLSVVCDTCNDKIKDSLLEKTVGKRIVIVGEVSTVDGVSGYTVDIKKVK
ncbi:MAG: hypothetical protein IKK55_02505 [Clostridia bacterium]|nr:hypothetical protein [Clostridia bacterium]MBR6741163.1 hypothetical protein [Clostridia bacterium]